MWPWPISINLILRRWSNNWNWSVPPFLHLTGLLYLSLSSSTGLLQSQMACSTCSHRVRPEHDLLQSLQCQTLRTTTQTTRLQVPLRRTVRSANGRIGHSLGLLSMWIHSDHARWSRNERLLSALHADRQLLVLETLSHDEQDELLHQGRRQESDIGREHRQATRRCVSICDVFQRMMSVLFTGVLGLCAIVLSSPYEIPIFVPEALMLLCEHSHDPDLIQVGPSREWGCELICCFCRNRSRNRCRSSVGRIMIRGMSTVRSSLKINWWCSPMSSFHPVITHRRESNAEVQSMHFLWCCSFLPVFQSRVQMITMIRFVTLKITYPRLVQFIVVAKTVSFLHLSVVGISLLILSFLTRGKRRSFSHIETKNDSFTVFLGFFLTTQINIHIYLYMWTSVYD